jgi:aminoglycoside/choline kinase family phosphotransferase/choline kinase
MRLRPLTESCPKPLLPLGGRPIITYAMDHLLTVGVERFIVNTHHCPDAYRQAFPQARWRGIPIIFRHEPVLLDTAGGIKNIEDLLKGDERLLVYNADVVTNLPLTPLLEAHARQKGEATLVLRSDGPLCNVDLDEDGRICDMRRMLNRPGVRSCLFTGIYVIEKPFLRRLTAGRIESVVPVFVHMISRQPGSVAGVLIDQGAWQDIGTLETYRDMMRRSDEEGAAGAQEFRSPDRPAAVHVRFAGHEQAQPFEAIADIAVRRYVRRVLNRAEATITDVAPLAKGGSDRTFRRIRLSDAPSVIFMHYNSNREENRNYASIADFLRELGVAVPGILHHDSKRCFILMEDLGDVDLWSRRRLPWSKRRNDYRRVLAMIERLHAFPVEDLRGRAMTLMPGFGPELYGWERSYFLENLVCGVCGIDLDAREAAALEAELEALAGRLQQLGAGLVHRDFQSQNIMMVDGNPVLIDFQGMRIGSCLYDLGSLLYDPYVPIDEGNRLELLRYYYALRERDVGWDVFQEAFHEASAQRLMQALGAFGFLGRRYGRDDFLAHIPVGLQRLGEAASRSGRLPALRGLVARCGRALKLPGTALDAPSSPS